MEKLILHLIVKIQFGLKKYFHYLFASIMLRHRATDIIRGLVAIRILQNDNKKALFYGTTVFKRNEHDLFRDFEDEIPIYI